MELRRYYQLPPQQFGFRNLDRGAVLARQSQLLHDFTIGRELVLDGWYRGVPVSPKNKDNKAWNQEYLHRIEALAAKRTHLDDDFIPMHGTDYAPDLVSTLNYPYYRSRGPAIYRDWTTKVSSSISVGMRDALDFIDHLSKYEAGGGVIPKKFAIVEYGGGDGKNAADFLDLMKRINPRYYDCIGEYWLIDSSPELLETAKLNSGLKAHIENININGHVSTNLDPSVPTSLPVMLRRSSEFYSDLPYQELIFWQGKFFEAWFRLGLGNNSFEDRTCCCWDGPNTRHYIFHYVDKYGQAVTSGSLMGAFRQGDFDYLGHIYFVEKGKSIDGREPENVFRLFYPQFKYYPYNDIANYPFGSLIQAELEQTGLNDGQAAVVNYAALTHLGNSMNLLRQTPGAALFMYDASLPFGLSLRPHFFDIIHSGISYYGKATAWLNRALLERYISSERKKLSTGLSFVAEHDGYGQSKNRRVDINTWLRIYNR